MRPALLAATLAVALSACAGDAPTEAAGPARASDAPSVVNPGPGLEADPDAPPVQADVAASPQAAVDRLLAYLGAHAEGDRAAADTLWGPAGPVPEAQTVEPFRLPDVTVLSARVDKPGAVEDAVGSVRLGVPATLTVQTGDGTTDVALRYVMRRADDAPGAAPWQLRWHLDRVEASEPAG